MISKLIAYLIVAAVATVLSSASLFAASSSSNDAKIAYYTNKLKNLKAGRSSYATIRALTRRLGRLNPAKANYYYKVGIKKLEPELRTTRGTALHNLLARIVAISTSISADESDKVLKELKKTEEKVVPAEPTPTPYQAQVELGVAGTLA